jgi:hypothetical protein
MLLSVLGALSEERATLSVAISHRLFACTYLHVAYARLLLACIYTDQYFLSQRLILIIFKYSAHTSP